MDCLARARDAQYPSKIGRSSLCSAVTSFHVAMSVPTFRRCPALRALNTYNDHLLSNFSRIIHTHVPLSQILLGARLIHSSSTVELVVASELHDGEMSPIQHPSGATLKAAVSQLRVRLSGSCYSILLRMHKSFCRNYIDRLRSSLSWLPCLFFSSFSFQCPPLSLAIAVTHLFSQQARLDTQYRL